METAAAGTTDQRPSTDQYTEARTMPVLLRRQSKHIDEEAAESTV